MTAPAGTRPAKPPAPCWETIEQVLSEYAERSRWCTWRYQLKHGRWTKPPKMTDGEGASHSDPSTWATLAEVRAAYEGGAFDGIGLMLDDTTIVALDIDDAIREDGTMKPWAWAIVERVDSYTERSPSGRGLRILAYGWPLGQGHNRPHEDGRVEMYSRRRYVTMMGRHLEGTPPTIERRHGELQALMAEMFPDTKTVGAEHALPSVEDTALRTTMERDPGFVALMDGRVPDGYRGDDSSPSGLRMALIGKLSMHTDDEDQIERIVRMSKQDPSKFDERRGNTTLLQWEIRKALTSATAFRSNAAFHVETPTTNGHDAATGDHQDDDLPPEWREPPAADPAEAIVPTTDTGPLMLLLLNALADNARLRAENRNLKEAEIFREAVHRNTALRPRAKAVALAVIPEYLSARSRMGRDEVPISCKAIAERTGSSTKTVSLGLDELEPVLSHRVIRVDGKLDYATGAIEPSDDNRLVLMVKGDFATVTEGFKRVAELDPSAEKPQHGGKRIPRCADHPDDPVIHQTRCATCNRLLEETGPREHPSVKLTIGYRDTQEREYSSLWRQDDARIPPEACGHDDARPDGYVEPPDEDDGPGPATFDGKCTSCQRPLEYPTLMAGIDTCKGCIVASAPPIPPDALDDDDDGGGHLFGGAA
jgi:hypothetical protein